MSFLSGTSGPFRGERALAALLLALVVVSAAACDSSSPTPAPTPVPAPAPAPAPPPPPPPPPPAPAALESITLSESTVRSQVRPIATIRLTAAAPAGGAPITLESSNTDAAKVPANVTVAGGETTNAFAVDTSTVRSTTAVTITARYAGVTVSTVLTVLPPSLGASFVLTSPSKGDDACSIINAAGAVDCIFDARSSSGLISEYRWSFGIASREISVSSPDGNPVFTPVTDCSLLSGANLSSNGTVPMIAVLRVVDRDGTVSNPAQKNFELTTNGRCGY
jgi:hypothetical protein